MRRAKLGREFSKPIGTRPKPFRHLRIERRAPVPAMLGSEYEILVWKALRSLGYRPILQTPFRGGTAFPGGMRIDFILAPIKTVVRVMSWWHSDTTAQARDQYRLIYLRGLGFQVVDIWPDDLAMSFGAIRSWLERQLGSPTA